MPQTIYIKDYDTEVTIPDGADMDQVQAALRQQFPPKSGAPIEQQQPQEPTFMQNMGQQLRSGVRPALEMGGALAGAVLAAPGNVVAPGLSSLAGAGLGYAAGRQIANALDERSGYKKPDTLPQALASTAMAILEGAAMEAGGALIGKGLQTAFGAIAKEAPKIWERIAKIPPRSIPKPVRDKAIKTALEYGISPTEKGLGKLRGMIDETNQKIAATIDDAMDFTKRAETLNKKSGVMEFSEGKIPVRDLTARLDEVKQWAKNAFENPKPIFKMVEDAKAEIRMARGRELTIAEAQKLKQGIYKRLTDKSYMPFADDTMAVNRKISKTFARSLKDEIVKRLPELQKLNDKDSALIGLQNILEKSVNRIRNRDLFGLSELAGSGVGALGGAFEDKSWSGAGKGAVMGALTMKFLRSPEVMSRIAFALNKASKFKGAPLLSRLAGYGAVQAGSGGRKELEGGLSNAIGSLDVAKASEAAEPLNSAQQATKAYLAGDYAGAIAGLRQAIKDDPGRAKYYRNELSRVMFEKGEYDRVMKKYGGKP